MQAAEQQGLDAWQAGRLRPKASSSCLTLDPTASSVPSLSFFKGAKALPWLSMQLLRTELVSNGHTHRDEPDFEQEPYAAPQEEVWNQIQLHKPHLHEENRVDIAERQYCLLQPLLACVWSAVCGVLPMLTTALKTRLTTAPSPKRS